MKFTQAYLSAYLCPTFVYGVFSLAGFPIKMSLLDVFFGISLVLMNDKLIINPFWKS